METKPKFQALGLFDAKVPRYTSYPTAPHFSSDIGANTLKSWISTIPEGSAISFYIHVPFCRRLCWFCACRTQGTTQIGPVQAYLETLKQEMSLLVRALPDGIRLNRVHWGGGTPTLLDAGMISDLADTIAAALPMTEDAEFSVEIDPNEIDQPRVDALAVAGMNRSSIGVQDFDSDIQKVIGREQSFEITQQAVGMLRAAGIYSLNTDILFGLPHQSPQKITDSVQKLLSLEPDRVALYGYAHVPWMARRQSMIPSDSLPTPEQRLRLFETARRLFVWDGYDEIGIDHFAVPTDGLSLARKGGHLRRNFQGYTDDQNPVLIGLGASAISRFPQGYAQNAPSTGAYTKHIRAGEFATTRGHLFSADDLVRARIIERLMCDFTVRESDFAEPIGPWLDEVHRSFEGVLRRSSNALTIPAKARPLTRMVARAFDTYAVDSAGHSHAI